MNISSSSRFDRPKISSAGFKIQKSSFREISSKVGEVSSGLLNRKDAFRVPSDRSFGADRSGFLLVSSRFNLDLNVATETEFALIFKELLTRSEFSKAEKFLEENTLSLFDRDEVKIDGYFLLICQACINEKKISECFTVLKKIQTKKIALKVIEYSLDALQAQIELGLVENQILKISDLSLRSWGVFNLYRFNILKNRYIYAENLLKFIVDLEVYSNARFFLFSHYFDQGLLLPAESIIPSFGDSDLEQFAYKKLFDRYFQINRKRNCLKIFSLINPSAVWYPAVEKKITTLFKVSALSVKNNLQKSDDLKN